VELQPFRTCRVLKLRRVIRTAKEYEIRLRQRFLLQDNSLVARFLLHPGPADIRRFLPLKLGQSVAIVLFRELPDWAIVLVELRGSITDLRREASIMLGKKSACLINVPCYDQPPSAPS